MILIITYRHLLLTNISNINIIVSFLLALLFALDLLFPLFLLTRLLRLFFEVFDQAFGITQPLGQSVVGDEFSDILELLPDLLSDPNSPVIIFGLLPL
jgi:hypothetical protein